MVVKSNTLPVWWLRVVAVFVVLTLAVGGATRLTDSGLSITQWEPILGVVPPLSEAAWQEALALYRQIPEYQLINKGMSLSEFQVIYLWEWGHRLVARTIGLVFVLHFAFFLVRRQLPGWFKPWGVLLLGLGGLQGFIGWWMVKSGLTERVDVSQYRLAVHLTLACIILALTVWLSERLGGRAGTVAAPALVRMTAIALPFAILAQIALGALVAGIDAGLASDTWPLMFGEVIPPYMASMQPLWINWFENPLAVQFNHRVGGYLVLLLVAVHAAAAHRARIGGPVPAILLALVFAQAASGVAVVMLHVPPVLAGTHQVMAAVMLWVAVVHAARLAPTPARALWQKTSGAKAEVKDTIARAGASQTG
ncbi:MAG: COX15/CtaA family protein [Pseudomonadota bacterium]